MESKSSTKWWANLLEVGRVRLGLPRGYPPPKVALVSLTKLLIREVQS
ncbi:MAG: hypothetical protein ICV54_27790 [Nostoc sp. C3-bin3]|nr:hypothetical protein [Nostoc sp. C3-bin3]